MECWERLSLHPQESSVSLPIGQVSPELFWWRGQRKGQYVKRQFGAVAWAPAVYRGVDAQGAHTEGHSKEAHVQGLLPGALVLLALLSKEEWKL